MKPLAHHPLVPAALLAALAVLLPGSAAGGPRAAEVPVVGPQECAECHVQEFAAWEESRHQVKSETLTRNAEAAGIAKALGIRRLKSDARCTSCHYTVQASDSDAPRAIAGVSCESCHGPAGEWLALHDDFGGESGTVEAETPEHRAARQDACDAAGMHRPGRIHDLVARCYRCHVMLDEELVDAGHPVGAGFELVCWSQGEVRHNYVRGGGANAECSAKRKRVLFVVGQLLELEHTLRALEASSGEGEYAAALAARAQAAIGRLEQIDAAASNASTARVLELVNGVTLEPADREAIGTVLDSIAAESAGFETAVESLDLAGIDALLPPVEAYVGEAAP